MQKSKKLELYIQDGLLCALTLTSRCVFIQFQPVMAKPAESKVVTTVGTPERNGTVPVAANNNGGDVKEGAAVSRSGGRA